MLSNMDAAYPIPPSPDLPLLPGSHSADGRSRGLSETLLRTLAQATGQIYWAADAQGALTDLTSWCAFTGQMPHEVSGMGWAAAVHPDDREQALKDWTTAIATGQPYLREHRVRRADGQYRIMLAQAYPICAPDGAVREWVGVDTDITLLHELRAEVQASQEEFRTTFELAAVGLAHVRPDGRILRVNQKLCAILGYTEDELLGRPFQQFTYSEDLNHNLVLLKKLLAGEISTYTLEKRYHRKDGSLVWANLTASLKRDLAGAPEYGIAVVEDISARKAAESALRASEQQYRQLFETMTQAVIYYSPDGVVLAANPAALRLLGGTPEKILGQTSQAPWLRVVREDGSPLSWDAFPTTRALRAGLPVSDIIGLLNPLDQRYRWLQVTAVPEFRPGEPKPYQVFATLEDITERRRLEEELRGRVQELEAIFASINDGLIVHRADGTIRRWNPAYTSLIGWPADSLFYAMSREERRQVLQIRDEEGQPLPLEQLPLSQNLQGKPQTQKQIFRRGDGQDAYVTVRGAPLTDASGRVVGSVEVVHDVTEQRRLEQQTQEALKALLRMAELLVQQPQEDKQGPPLEVGRHLAEMACSLLGCPVAMILTMDPQTLGMQMIGTVGFASEQESKLRTMIDTWTHSPANLADIARLMAGETLVIETTQPPYQEYASVFGFRQAIVAPMRLGGQLIGMVVFNPNVLTPVFTAQQIALAGATAQLVGLVVERDRLLREREEARARALALQEANRQMDTFLSLVSHEIRSPLASTKLSLQVIHRRLDRAFDDATAAESDLQSLLAVVQQLFAPAERNIVRLERMVNDLLQAARLKQRTLDLQRQPADLVAVVQEVVAEQQALSPERPIHFHTSANQPLIVNVDVDRIRQAILNYLANALTYSLASTPVEVGIDQEEGQARVWVRDHGPGIPPAEQERVWDRFHRVPGIRGHNGTSGSLGLGLYITKMVIEGHQGQVGISSAPGQGATFWFRLALA